MDLPADVLLHNQVLGLKNTQGTLIAISPHGYYEVRCAFGGNQHRVLLPVPETVVIFRDPEDIPSFADEIER